MCSGWCKEAEGMGTDGVHVVDPATASMVRRRGRSELEHQRTKLEHWQTKLEHWRTNGGSTSDNLAATQRTKEEGQCGPG